MKERFMVMGVSGCGKSSIKAGFAALIGAGPMGGGNADAVADVHNPPKHTARLDYIERPKELRQ